MKLFVRRIECCFYFWILESIIIRYAMMKNPRPPRANPRATAETLQNPIEPGKCERHLISGSSA